MGSKMTLRSKMTIGGVLLLLIPLTVVGIYSYMQASDGVTAEGYAKSRYLAQMMADMVEGVLEAQTQGAVAVAQFDSVKRTAEKAAGATKESNAAINKTLWPSSTRLSGPPKRRPERPRKATPL